MKIGLVCPYNIFRGGGVQECVLALQEGIIKRGHEAYIITPRPNDHNGDHKDGVILVGRARPVRAAQTSAQISVNVEPDKLDQLLEEEKFDLLHFHEPWIPILSMQILSRSDAIHVATFHAAMSERRTSRTVEKVITPYTKSIFKYIDVLTAVSPTATNYVGSLTRRPIEIVSNGIDLKKYHETNNHHLDPKLKKLLYVGRLEKRKGVRYLLDALKLLSENDKTYKLAIAGDGPDREKLEQYVKKESIKNVKFLGYIDEKTKLKLLGESDIFCSPALYGESFGIVLLEAMATGCVAIAGNNSGYDSVMSGRGQISLVNPKDTLEFARRIKLLATDEVIRKAWKEWARDHVKTYDYDKVIDDYVDVYEKAYEQKHKKT